MIAFLRRLGRLWACIPVGLLFLILGIVVVATSPKSYEKTTGVITDTRSYYDTDEGTKYEYDFTYTVDGTEYRGTFGGDSEDKTGDRVTVFYDPADPASCSNTEHTGVVGVVLIVIGAAVLALGVFTGIRVFAAKL